jgi:PAS domain S-box-containing protein
LTARPERTHTRSRVSRLKELAADVEGALEDVNIPSYVIDASGVIRWVNPAAQRLVGDCRGRQFTSLVAPEHKRHAREVFAQKIIGRFRSTESEGVLIAEDGERIEVEVCSVPLQRGHRVIGVFGQIPRWSIEPHAQAHPHLTPRQAEVLRLLEHGRSTAQIAGELHLSQETVRNHVRHLLRALGVNSRLEAVAVARQHASLN